MVDTANRTEASAPHNLVSALLDIAERAGETLDSVKHAEALALLALLAPIDLGNGAPDDSCDSAATPNSV